MRKINLLLILILLLSACSFADNKNLKNMGNRKILMVVAPKDFRDQEYNDPKRIFDKAGYDVEIASIQTGKAIGAEGTKLEVDINISEVKPEDFDAVVFVGGPGMAQITGDEALQILAKKFYAIKKLTAAICVAPEILAKADILRNKKATSWEGSKNILEKFGANYTDDDVVIDGNIITANGPASAKKFGETIIKELNK